MTAWAGDGPWREPNFERRDYSARSMRLLKEAWEQQRRNRSDGAYPSRLNFWASFVEDCQKFTSNDQWAELFRQTDGIIETTERLNLHPETREFVVNGYLKHYLWPCTNQVYGVRITDEHDWDLFMKQQLKRWGKPAVKEQNGPVEGDEEKEEKSEKWSLGVPEDQNDFVKWFEDEKTGKPIFRQDPSKSDKKKPSK